MPDFTLEQVLKGPVAGLDEAGCGPWAGPVMAGAAILHAGKLPAILLENLNDSKKLTLRKRNELYHILCQEQGQSVIWSSAFASVEEIDRMNIRQAALLAMSRAVEKLSVKPNAALVDGIVAPRLHCPVQTVKSGDSLSLSIAAASIIAKVERDTYMLKLGKKFPHYGWHTNAGYGTAAHIAAIQAYGLTAHHRRSFKPVANFAAM